MNIHDMVVQELLDKKSVSALIYLIEHGRELEFKAGEKNCFISKNGSERKFSLWTEKNEQSFNSMEELIEKSKIDGISFLDIWNKVEIETLF